MYKVFINDKAIILTDNHVDYTSQFDTLFIKYKSEEAMKLSVNLVLNKQLENLVIIAEDLNELWRNFCAMFESMEAAGGVVKNDQGAILFVLKNGIWDLPKGKIDSGESVEDAAVREVKEECGVDDVHISRPLQDSYHIFTKDDQQILKHTNWFEMTSNHNGELKGDEKEGITEVSWIKNDQLEEILSNSYPSIRDLIQSATS